MTKTKIIPSANFHPKTWSGGTTNELFIYPSAAKYAERNFNFRLSTATVEVEESIFTPLPEVSRTLIVLDGKMSLSHEGHHTSELGKLDMDKFEGRWNTSSEGKCTDFNLMTIGKTSGSLIGIALENDQSTTTSIEEQCDWFFVYLYSGHIMIAIDGEEYIINKGDLFILNEPKFTEIKIHAKESSELVLCHITH